MLRSQADYGVLRFTASCRPRQEGCGCRLRERTVAVLIRVGRQEGSTVRHCAWVSRGVLRHSLAGTASCTRSATGWEAATAVGCAGSDW